MNAIDLELNTVLIDKKARGKEKRNILLILVLLGSVLFFSKVS